jgi:hypothetical protein
VSLFFAGLTLVVLALLARACRPLARTASWLWFPALLAYGIPAVFFTYWMVAAPQDATRLRIALLGLGFRAADKDLTLGISGDQKHAVWIDGLPRQVAGKPASAGALVLHPLPQGGTGVGTVSLSTPITNLPGIVAFGSPAGLALPNALELQDSDRISFADETWRVQFNPQLLGLGPPRISLVNEAQETPVPLPGRRSEIPILKWQLPVWKALPVTQRTYPLDTLLGAAVGPGSPTGFLYQHEDRLFLALLKSGIRVNRGGKWLKIQQTWPVVPGTRLHVLGLPRWTEEATRAAGGVRDLRSFRVHPGQHSLMLVYDSPEVHTLGWQDLDNLRMQKGHSSDLDSAFRVSLAVGDWYDRYITDGYLYLRHASRRVGGEAFAILELLTAWNQGFTDWDGPMRLAAPGGRIEIADGKPFWLGEEYLAAVQLDLLKPPVQLAFLTLLLALLKALAATRAQLSAAQLLAASAIELFVVFRVTLGYRVWAMPPLDQEAMELALIAWALLPWAFLTASLPSLRNSSQPRLWRALPAAAGLLFAAVWCYRVSGSPVWPGCAIGLLALPFLHPPDQPVRRQRRPQPRPATGGFLRIVNRLPPWLARGAQGLARGIHFVFADPRCQVTLWCLAGLSMTLLRLLLALLGLRESLYIGTRFPSACCISRSDC